MRSDDDVIWHVKEVDMPVNIIPDRIQVPAINLKTIFNIEKPRYKLKYFRNKIVFIGAIALLEIFKVKYKLIIDKNKKYFWIITKKS